MVRWADEEGTSLLQDSPLSRPIMNFDGLSDYIGHWINDSIEITDQTSALKFLDPSYSEHNQYPDDTIIALAAAKASDIDSKSQQQKVNKAVRLIAEHRNSVVLHA